MLAVDQVAIVNMNKLTPPHCFEVVTKEITYYIGMEIPDNGKARNKMMKTLQSKYFTYLHKFTFQLFWMNWSHDNNTIEIISFWVNGFVLANQAI